MYRLTYQDSYQVERILEYSDYDELMLSLSGCVTLADTFLVTSLTLDDKVIYQGLVGDLYRFLSQSNFSD
ncbi:hypothetical protein D8802_00705 [Streptococcus oralis]|uniref:DUF4649 domain-containing protein n=1 Tax=Streptococcus oralis TaxID=1303 RepID=A0A3R9KIH5_STROR|nr:DUF4649 family protein [Streptococcus oralis]RSJ69107.1 hypothetical protein D8802_00705 [Streptococcus oralis]